MPDTNEAPTPQVQAEMSDEQLNRFWYHRDCLDAINQGDLMAQLRVYARAVIAADRATRPAEAASGVAVQPVADVQMLAEHVSLLESLRPRLDALKDEVAGIASGSTFARGKNMAVTAEWCRGWDACLAELRDRAIGVIEAGPASVASAEPLSDDQIERIFRDNPPEQGEGRATFLANVRRVIAASVASVDPLQELVTESERLGLYPWQKAASVAGQAGAVGVTDTERLDWLLPNLHPATWGMEFDGGYEWSTDAEFLTKWRSAIDRELAAQAASTRAGE